MAKKTSGSGSRAAADSFTDTARVKQLIALMADNGLTEIELVEGQRRIALRRGGAAGAVPTGAMVHHLAPAAQAAASAPAVDVPRVEEAAITIKSPMVGTFYAAPNPESDAYISIGSEVEKDKTVVCVIEAMKVFNEIHADATGTVVKILVSNGQAVEYGQPLFQVKAS